MPTTEFQWREVAKTFEKWNFPNCVGAMDGKHIHLQAPINSGTEFYNYKGYCSIVLFAVVDGSYNFTYANVGCQGRISDAGIFHDTMFKECLENNTMSLPPPCTLPGTTTVTPFVFLGDDAFPLSPNIMKPYPGLHQKGSKERIFNYRLSRGRRISENVFGIISTVFRILRKPMLLEPKVATTIVLAIIHLHNFLRKTASKKIYNPSGTFDKECPSTGEIKNGIWKKDTSQVTGLTNLPKVPRRSKHDAQTVRNTLMEYFCSPEGEVPFQYTRA